MNFTDFLLGFSFVVLIVVVSALSYNFGYTHSTFLSNPLIQKSYDESFNCNMDLKNTSECLNTKLLTFFKYNISNINKQLTLDELKEQGGVCWQYADWYISQINKSMFYTEILRFPTGNGSGHAVALMSNEEGYCILDQAEVNCQYLG